MEGRRQRWGEDRELEHEAGCTLYTCEEVDAIVALYSIRWSVLGNECGRE